jgi:hypothetical protein
LFTNRDIDQLTTDVYKESLYRASRELDPKLDPPSVKPDTTYRRHVQTQNSPRTFKELIAEKFKPRKTGLDGFREFSVDQKIEKGLRKTFDKKIFDAHDQQIKYKFDSMRESRSKDQRLMENSA